MHVATSDPQGTIGALAHVVPHEAPAGNPRRGDGRPAVVCRRRMSAATPRLFKIQGITREQADALVHAGMTRLEDLLQADENDLKDIPQIGDQAGAVLNAVRAESLRRTLNV